MRLSSEAMEVTAFKAAEDGRGYIVRVSDRYGVGSQGEIVFDGQTFLLELKPSDVKTLRFVRGDDSWRVIESTMLERPM